MRSLSGRQMRLIGSHQLSIRPKIRATSWRGFSIQRASNLTKRWTFQYLGRWMTSMKCSEIDQLTKCSSWATQPIWRNLGELTQTLIERGRTVSLVTIVKSGDHGIRGRVTSFAGIPMISFGPQPADQLSLAIQRAVDVTVAFAFLTLFSWLYLGISLLVWVNGGLAYSLSGKSGLGIAATILRSTNLGLCFAMRNTSCARARSYTKNT